MRVAIVTDTYHPDVNGVVNTISYLEKEFDKLGLQYKIFSPGDLLNSDEKHYHFKARQFIFYNKLHFSFVLYSTLETALNAFNADVLHIVTEGPLGIHATRYAKKESIPYIASYTTDLPNYFKHYGFDILKHGLKMYLKYVHNDAYLNLVPSEFSYSQLVDMNIFNNVIWKRGIDHSNFHPEENHKLSSRKKLLYVGRIAKEKNIEVLLDMAKILNDRNFDYELIIVGLGPILEELKQKNIENVTYRGALIGEDLYRAYREADVFVFASEHETFGNVILEAMASGLPVIATNKAGVKENLRDGYNSIALSKSDPKLFANAVEEIFRDENRYYQLREQAVEFTKDKTWQHLTNELIKYYQKAQIYKENNK